MTEEENHIDDREDWVELQLSHKDYTLIVMEPNWMDAVLKVEVGKMKLRIVEAVDQGLMYNFENKQWLLEISESAGDAKTRIALALLFSFPKSITRNQLSLMTNINKSSLKSYLSKSKPEVSLNVTKTNKNVVLNKNGYKWAIEILNSIEQTKESEGGDIGKSTKNSNDTLDQENQ